jgi:CubicO group peptidase (beta-lactamase class C family)
MTPSFVTIEDALDAAVGHGVFPGAVLLVREADRVFYLRAFGRRTREADAAPMTESTIFDLSSLTKALATSIALMLLVRDGKIRLDDRVTRFFHNFGVYGKTHDLRQPQPPCRVAAWRRIGRTSPDRTARRAGQLHWQSWCQGVRVPADPT